MSPVERPPPRFPPDRRADGAFSVAGLAVLLAALVVAGCGGGGGGAAATEPAGFVIATSTPADGQTGFAPDQPIRVTFSERVDPASVTSNSLDVGQVGLGDVEGTTRLLDDTQGRTLQWTPRSPLASDEVHVCTASVGIRSMEGENLSGDRAITFRTGSGSAGPTLPGPDNLRRTTGRLNVGRRSHTATRLPGGPVLVAGGYVQGTNITDRAELYTSDVFVLLEARMVEERAGHTATRLLDGRVLLTGGWYETSAGFLATTDGAEVFDPATSTFTPVGDMSTERVDHAAVRLPDGTVLITGGSRYEGTFLRDLDTAEIFDPVTNTFTELAAKLVHTHATHVMLDQGNGRILLYGGSDVDLRPERYDVATGLFQPLAPAAQDGVRWGACGDVFQSGGACIAGGDNLATVVYVYAANGFAQNTGSGLGANRRYATATRYADDRVLVVGGIDWTQGGFLHATCDVVIEGGVSGSATWQTDMRFPTGMVDHTATPLGDGRILFCGGLNANGGEPELDGAYVFDPFPD